MKPQVEWTEVPAVRFEGGTKLPRREPAWPAQTKRWWAAVSAMPHCMLWAESDWAFAIDTALVAAAFHGGDMKAAAELRQREKIMGTTVDARRDLRIRYVDQMSVEQPVKPAEVADLSERRRRLASDAS